MARGKFLSEETLCPAAVTEALKKAYAALNEGDVGGFVEVFAADVERIEPSDLPLGGRFRGLEAVRAHIAEGRGSWAEGRCEPERFTVVGDKVIVVLNVRVRLKHEAGWREGRIADVFAFRNGRVSLFRTFVNEQEALDWVAGDQASR